MLQSNPRLIHLLALILSSAPRLGAIITAKPLVFDGMLDPAFFSGAPGKEEQRTRLEDFLGEARAYEETLDRLRIFAAEQRFLIGVRLLTGNIEAMEAGHALADLAELIIEYALDGRARRTGGKAWRDRGCASLPDRAWPARVARDDGGQRSRPDPALRRRRRGR
jgi:glutamine synthetase adenylyltransferase